MYRVLLLRCIALHGRVFQLCSLTDFTGLNKIIGTPVNGRNAAKYHNHRNCCRAVALNCISINLGVPNKLTPERSACVQWRKTPSLNVHKLKNLQYIKQTMNDRNKKTDNNNKPKLSFH